MRQSGRAIQCLLVAFWLAPEPASAQTCFQLGNCRSFEGAVGSVDNSRPPLGFRHTGEPQPTCVGFTAFSVTLNSGIDTLDPQGTRGCNDRLSAPGYSPFTVLVNASGSPPNPHPDLGTLRIGQGSYTSVPYFHSTSGSFGTAAVALYFHVNNTGTVQCPSAGCTGFVDAPLHAKFGSVKGRVTYRTGQSVGPDFVVAAYAADNLQTPARTVLTDANGFYDFTVTDAARLLNENSDIRRAPGFIFTGSVPIPPSNNWGLAVCGNEGFGPCPPRRQTPGRGERRYELVAGPELLPGTSPNGAPAFLVSSEAETLDLLAPCYGGPEEGGEIYPGADCGDDNAGTQLTPSWGRFGRRQVLESDAGEKLEIHCMAGAVPSYMMFYTGPTGRYRVGLCPYQAGCNTISFTYSGDRDRNGKPDCISSTYWRSIDLDEDDPGYHPGFLDAMYTYFDARTGFLTKEARWFHYAELLPDTGCGLKDHLRGGPVRGGFDFLDPPLGPATEAGFDALFATLQQTPPSPLAMSFDSHSRADLNRDGVNDRADLDIFNSHLHECRDDVGYNPDLDLDFDGCIDERDHQAFVLFLPDWPPNQPPVARCQDLTAPVDASCRATVAGTAVDSGSTDPEDEPMTFTLDPAGPFYLGTHAVTLTVKDAAGATDSCASTVTAADLAPPSISQPAVDRDDLRPVDRSMVPVVVSYEARDDCHPYEVSCALSVTSNEPVGGTGPADREPDWQVLDRRNVLLRAERASRNSQRIYTITVTCTADGLSSQRAVAVRVHK